MTRTGPFERLKGFYPLTIVIAVLALSLQASLASAQTCLQDEYSLTATQKLTCSANDVKVAKVINVRDLNGVALPTCNANSTFNFIADFLVQTSSKSSRSNIGLYFATQQSSALKGQCSDNVIPAAPYTCPGSPSSPGGTAVQCQSTHYDEFDSQTPPDNCGDSSSSDPTVCLDANNQVVACPAGGGPPAGGAIFPGTQVVTIEIDNFKCTAPAGTNQVVLPNCTSWQVPGSTTVCEAVPPNYNYPFDNKGKPEAIPGSPSKCNCGTIPLGITVQSPAASVTKSCTVGGDTPSTDSTSCNLSPEGGTVTYTVDVTNNSNFGDIVVDQICDSAYGTVFQAAGFNGPACQSGSAGSNTGGSCTTSALTVAQGKDASCTFTASQPEAITVTDTVSITGHGSTAGTFGPTTSNSVQVTSNEAPSTATITKSFAGLTAGCATVRYGVDVANTSSPDEDIKLSALFDSPYGSITSVHGSVLGTTCGVASGSYGLGTMAQGQPNQLLSTAGTLPDTINVGGADYTCQFDAQLCGTLTTITLPNNTTCSGIHQTDSVSASMTGVTGLTGDEGETVTETDNALTVDVCFTSAVSSSP